MSDTRDIGVIAVIFSGRPNFLAVVDAYVNKSLSRGSSSSHYGGCHWDEKDFEEYEEMMAKWYDDGGYCYDEDDYYDAQAEYCGSLGGSCGYPTEDDYGMEDYEQVFPPIDDGMKGSRGKRGHRGKKKNSKGKFKHVCSSNHKKGRKCNIVSISGEPLYGDEYDDGDYSVDTTLMNGYKKIYFYEDYCDKGAAIKFYSLPMFLDYCEKRGIHVNKFVIDMMKSRTESHCCVNKEILESKHEFKLESEESYGSMVYSAATQEDIENLSEVLKL